MPEYHFLYVADLNKIISLDCIVQVDFRQGSDYFLITLTNGERIASEHGAAELKGRLGQIGHFLIMNTSPRQYEMGIDW